MKIYLISYDASFGDSQSVIALLKTVDSIRDLRACMENSCFVKSTELAKELSAKIIKLFPNCRFFITEISSNRQGWLPKDVWEFVKDL